MKSRDKRPRSDADGDWRPGAERSHGGYPYAALDHDDTVINSEGEKTPIKTAVAFDFARLNFTESMSPRKLAMLLDRQKFPKQDRIIASLIFNDNNSPIGAYTVEKRTKLRVRTRLGYMYTLDNRRVTPEGKKPVRVAEIEQDNPILESDAVKNIRRCFAECKTKSAIITKSSLDESKNERDAERKKRNQNAVMALDKQSKHGSATQYVKAIYSMSTTYHQDHDDIEKVTHHWCHLIAYFMQGKTTQHESNLVAASKEANSAFTIFEQRIKQDVLKYYPKDGISLKVKASLIKVKNSTANEHLQYATHFEITTISKDLTTVITIDAQDRHNPHISSVTYDTALHNAARDKKPINAKDSARRINSIFNRNDATKEPEIKQSTPGLKK